MDHINWTINWIFSKKPIDHVQKQPNILIKYFKAKKNHHVSQNQPRENFKIIDGFLKGKNFCLDATTKSYHMWRWYR